jgi:putative transposase
LRYPKRPRIKEFSYQGSFAYFTTIRTHQKSPYFQSEQVAKIVHPILQLAASRFRFAVVAYCFMPDHLHLLLAGEENSSLKDFMKIFKQRSGFYFKQRYNAPLWQPSYYDHVSRKEESLEEVARYIFENPVRKGLVDDWREYPLLGSMVFDLNEL